MADIGGMTEEIEHLITLHATEMTWTWQQKYVIKFFQRCFRNHTKKQTIEARSE